jgi:hypothetical protein
MVRITAAKYTGRTLAVMMCWRQKMRKWYRAPNPEESKQSSKSQASRHKIHSVETGKLKQEI